MVTATRHLIRPILIYAYLWLCHQQSVVTLLYLYSMCAYKLWTYFWFRKFIYSFITLITVIFCHMTTNFCLFCFFFQAEFKYVIRIGLWATVCLWQNFLKCNFSEFSFSSSYQYVLNMAEAFCYILNLVWVWKLNITKRVGM